MTTTKSFNEVINEVKNSKGTNKAKRDALVKLGLRPLEVEYLMADWAREARANRSPRIAYTFGVEIECGVCYQQVRAEGIRFEYQGYNHRDSREVFKFVTDSSLHINNSIECVTPVLSSRGGFDKLKACCKALNDNDARVNSSCGLHVHIGASHLSDEAYKNVFINYAYLEDVIDTFMASSRRGNGCTWAASMKRYVERIKNCSTIADVRYNIGTRYTKVNAEAYGRHKTIEFRQHQGTTNYEKIANWVKFVAKLVEWSKDNRLERDITTIDEIPFLNASEKAFFKARKSEFETRSNG